MGRAGITYEMVEAAANALEAERTGSATLKAVRAHLGTGSPNTVHRFMKMWAENRPKAAAPLVAIPDDVSRMLSTWVLQASTGARDEAEQRAMHAELDADELARAGEQLESERDDLQAEIAALTTQRDKEQATAKAHADEIKRLLAEVERERGLAGVAQIEAAQARLRADSQVEQLTEMRARVESLSASIETERTARTAAERDAAVSAAQLAGTRAELDAARALVVTLQQDLAASRERFDARVQQDQALLDELRDEHQEEIDALLGAVNSARDAVVAEAAEKFKALSQLAIEQERGKAAAEKAQDALAAERARAAMLDEERADLRGRLQAAEARAVAAEALASKA
jgi:colicin import membrane protein